MIAATVIVCVLFLAAIAIIDHIDRRLP